MRMRGLEPPRGCPHTDLNRARLPIPPHPRVTGIVAGPLEKPSTEAGFARLRHAAVVLQAPPEKVEPEGRLSPATPRGCPHTDLNRARLPIPPHPRGGRPL